MERQSPLLGNRVIPITKLIVGPDPCEPCPRQIDEREGSLKFDAREGPRSEVAEANDIDPGVVSKRFDEGTMRVVTAVENAILPGRRIEPIPTSSTKVECPLGCVVHTEKGARTGDERKAARVEIAGR